MRKIVTLVLLSAFALGGAACNTVQGMGKDVESVGKTGEEAIDKEKK